MSLDENYTFEDYMFDEYAAEHHEDTEIEEEFDDNEYLKSLGYNNDI